jgi:uncharacterized protein (TIGR02217 family)
MAYWLAQHLADQEQGVIKRFAPPWWTINFPRPMMASVVTLGTDGLRVDATFHSSGDLAGLIWEAEDRWSHPLLRYETARDFRNCALNFRWRSAGIKPLDAINGPTLTIEGRDESGAARTWYVRLWNYAEGTPTNAEISIDFNALEGGFLLPAEADPVWAGDIDRLFISLVPLAYDGAETVFAGASEGWVELTEMRCDGPGSVIAVGDVMVPEHQLQIATGYDDAYNQTPERLLRQILALGYRGVINHYVGMSHYFRLEPNDGGLYVSLAGGALNAPCARWHEDFAQRAKALDFGLILSLSYELFDAHCWNDWKQRAANGAPALTGWVPPSTLLSPAHAGAMGYLQAVARGFVAIVRDSGLPVQFQIGEPWWWILPDGRPCIYDEAARVALGGAPPNITSIKGSHSPIEMATLDAAGALLAASTTALGAAVRTEAPDAELLILVFLPTLLDPEAPDIRRLDLPAGWAKPAFNVLQVEDYDWVTAGRTALIAQARQIVTERLGYPINEQHYLAGFVPAHFSGPQVAQAWQKIAAAAQDGLDNGYARTFVWALPQIMRDGFTWFQIEGESSVQSFDDVYFPLDIGQQAQVSPRFSTRIIESASGHEQRSTEWADARLSFDAGPGVRSEADVATLISFFRARRGAARGFRFADPYDDRSGPPAESPSPLDQVIGTGDGDRTEFQLVKHYGDSDDAQERRITRPRSGSIRIALGGLEQAAGWQHLGGGRIAFALPPANGISITAGYLFDVPVRFAQDRIDIDRETFAAGTIPSIPLVEIRE